MKKGKVILWFILSISVVVGTSILSNRIWGGKPEKIEVPEQLIVREGMSVKEFGKANAFSNPQLKQIFGLTNPSDLEKKVTEYYPEDNLQSMVKKKLALASEASSKNWRKIVIKFAVWFAFLTFVYLYLRKRKLTTPARRALQISAITLFGIILGSDPSPMGTVKDAIFLLGSAGTVFLPRMIAFAVFILLVVVANKYICSWGCQAGVLQDYIFRMNRDDHKKSKIRKQIKIPFPVSNTIRILFFLAIVTFSFVWVFDIVEPIDIFKVFNPLHLGIAGIVFVGIILIISLFIYRPWCHFLCPFGLIGWLFEKLSLVRINVDYDSCTACKKCASACPTDVMEAILLRDRRVIPDCFSCYTCRDTCPTGSIQFSSRKRVKPPPGKFDK